MNIHLPAILGFTRYQGFDPSPYPKMAMFIGENDGKWWTNGKSPFLDSWPHHFGGSLTAAAPHGFSTSRQPVGGNLTQISDEPMVTDAAKSRQQTGWCTWCTIGFLKTAKTSFSDFFQCCQKKVRNIQPMLPCSHVPCPFFSIVLPTMGMFTHHLGCPSRNGVGACSSVSPHHLSPCWSTAPFAWCSWTGRSPCAATLSRCFFGDRGQVSVSKWRNWFRVKQQLQCNYSMYSDRMGM